MVNVYKIVDILKFIFAIFILCIHSDFLKGTTAYEWVTPLLFRLAVPYFFIASGFFLGNKVYNLEKYNGFTQWKVYISRLLQKLIVFEPINIIFQCVLFLYVGKSILSILGIVIQSVFFYPWGALWYIQGLIVAVIIAIPFIKRGREGLCLLLGVFFYLIGLLGNRYYFLIGGTELGLYMLDLLKVVVSLRNGLCFGLIYVTIGLLLAKNWNNVCIKKKRNLSLFIGGYLLLFVEVYLLQDEKGIDDNSMFLFAPFAVMMLFIASAQYSSRGIKVDTVLLRNLSTSIYLLHKPVLFVIRYGYEFILGDTINSYLLTILAIVVVLCICVIVYSRRIQPLYNWIK